MTKMRQKLDAFRERNRKSGGYLLKKKLSNFIFKLCRAILIFGLCFLILQPLLNKLSISFMDEKDLYDSTVINIPRNFSTSSYSIAWELMRGVKALWTSFYIAILVAVFQVICSTLVGYGFARYKFPFKNFWFFCVILVIIVPPQTISTPLYLFFQDFDVFGLFSLIRGSGFNLLGSLYPYLLMCLFCAGYKGGLYIYLMRQHFRNEPKELEEAAYVDGCGKLRTFFTIMIPGAKPIMTSCFLFAFVWQWTDAYYSKIFYPQVNGWILVTNRLTTLTYTLETYMKRVYGPAYKPSIAFSQQVLSTGTLITLIPLILLYVVAQKAFVESLSQSGIKM